MAFTEESQSILLQSLLEKAIAVTHENVNGEETYIQTTDKMTKVLRGSIDEQKSYDEKYNVIPENLCHAPAHQRVDTLINLAQDAIHSDAGFKFKHTANMLKNLHDANKCFYYGMDQKQRRQILSVTLGISHCALLDQEDEAKVTRTLSSVMGNQFDWNEKLSLDDYIVVVNTMFDIEPNIKTQSGKQSLYDLQFTSLTSLAAPKINDETLHSFIYRMAKQPDVEEKNYRLERLVMHTRDKRLGDRFVQNLDWASCTPDYFIKAYKKKYGAPEVA